MKKLVTILLGLFTAVSMCNAAVTPPSGGGSGSGDFMADGSVPMTGDLDMDDNNITNAMSLHLNPLGEINWGASDGFSYKTVNGGYGSSGPASADPFWMFSDYTDSVNFRGLELSESNSTTATITARTTAGNYGLDIITSGTGVVNVPGDFQVGGQILAADGTAGAPSVSFSNDSNTGFYYPSASGFIAAVADGNVVWSSNPNGFYMPYLPLRLGGTYLQADADNTLALRYGVSAQTNRIYGTYTDVSNYERLTLQHDGSGTATIAAETAGTGADAQSLKIKLAGDGALYVDGDTAGNARGVNAIDLQVNRSAATQVASEANSVAIGARNTASDASAIVIGYGNTAGGSLGGPIAIGVNNNAEATYSQAFGYYSKAYLYGQKAHASGRFANNGDAQPSSLVARNTCTAAAADLFLDGTDDRLVIPANTVWRFRAMVTAMTQNAAEVGSYKVEGTLKRDGSSNTTLVWSTATVEHEDDASWALVVSADDTNEALDINFDPGTDTCRVVAEVRLTEVAFP